MTIGKVFNKFNNIIAKVIGHQNLATLSSYDKSIEIASRAVQAFSQKPYDLEMRSPLDYDY